MGRGIVNGGNGRLNAEVSCPSGLVEELGVAGDCSKSHMLEHALGYAARGWQVLPLHCPVNGQCSCGKPDCQGPVKHPRTPNGLLDATTDVDTITNWWTSCPEANVGIRTGEASGIVVLDIDVAKGGLESWEELQDLHGRVDTLLCHTGGGGKHLYFRAPSEMQLKSGTGEIAPGIDTRAGSLSARLPNRLDPLAQTQIGVSDDCCRRSGRSVQSV